MTPYEANHYFETLPEGFAPAEELRAALPAAVQQVQFVGVAGTAGKTATAGLLGAILQAAGFVTGLYHAKESAVASLQMPYETYGEAFRISVPDTRTATKLIVQHPELFQDYEIMKGRMDDVFLAVTGKTTGGAAYVESHGIA